MIIDTSALLAILRAEVETRSCVDAVERSDVLRISAETFLEAAVVIDSNRDAIASRRLDDPLRAANITVEPVTKEQVQIGRAAYRDFGKEK